jgi:hypothetical protein
MMLWAMKRCPLRKESNREGRIKNRIPEKVILQAPHFNHWLFCKRGRQRSAPLSGAIARYFSLAARVFVA